MCCFYWIFLFVFGKYYFWTQEHLDFDKNTRNSHSKIPEVSIIQLTESLGINFCQVVGGRVKYKASPSEPLEMPKPTIYILVSMYIVGRNMLVLHPSPGTHFRPWLHFEKPSVVLFYCGTSCLWLIRIKLASNFSLGRNFSLWWSLLTVSVLSNFNHCLNLLPQVCLL